jgi:penicillin-binding protein 1A
VLDQGAAGKWRPANFDQDFNGPVSLRVALERSLNLVTVRIADKIGMEAVASNAIGFHVVDDMPRVLPAALGAVETTVLRQAAFYAAIANGGREVIPTLIDTVQDRTGRVIWRAKGLECQGCDDPTRRPQISDTRPQVADPESVFQLTLMMQGVVQRGTGAAAAVGLNRPLAGKTGTSQDFTDNWFVGFTPDLAVAVWMGFDNSTSLGNNETGGSNATIIFRDFMAAALRGRPALPFVPPPGVTLGTWDSGRGMVTDAFKPGQQPGASQSVVGTPAPAFGGVASGGTGVAPGGVDSALGGLY